MITQQNNSNISTCSVHGFNNNNKTLQQVALEVLTTCFIHVSVRYIYMYIGIHHRVLPMEDLYTVIALLDQLQATSL